MWLKVHRWEWTSNFMPDLKTGYTEVQALEPGSWHPPAWMSTPSYHVHLRFHTARQNPGLWGSVSLLSVDFLILGPTARSLVAEYH